MIWIEIRYRWRLFVIHARKHGKLASARASEGGLMIMIEIRYRWRLFVIHARKHGKLARLTLAGLLVKLAFWISPLFEYELSRGFTARPRAIKTKRDMASRD